MWANFLYGWYITPHLHHLLITAFFTHLHMDACEPVVTMGVARGPGLPILVAVQADPRAP
jgi:hypothetical protein